MPTTSSWSFQGQAIQGSSIQTPTGTVLELCFDLKGESVNKLNALTLSELEKAVQEIQKIPDVTGLLVTSAKDVFIVGADITEFLTHFQKSEEELYRWLLKVNETFSAIEDLPYPSVSLINGFALGGGFEVCLSTTYRIATPQSKMGLPETKLGLYPGWGGTVRLSRLCGVDNAVEWVASGQQYAADAGLKIGAVDAVVEKENLKQAGFNLVQQKNLDWKKRVLEKKSPIRLNKIEATMVFETTKAFIQSQAGPHYPAPVAAVDAIREGASLNRDGAIPIEARGFAKLAKSSQAASLVSVFLNDQAVKKQAKRFSKNGKPVERAAVLGAGIMGGGIAYQSASKRIPILMKDIQSKALEVGLTEAAKLFEKQVQRKKMNPAQMAQAMGSIHSTLSYGDFQNVDLIVEAVVENEKIKKAVLLETESQIKSDAILTSNTSTISITRLGEGLKRPELFCGMHFFNPVHKMPLVEVIRGKKSSEQAIATTVAYATALGKTPIVVNDCPGFLVNRVLFPYFSAFFKLVQDGVPFQRIDKVMEKFGWPMGPAYLLDVVGLDTGAHAQTVISQAFPDRMQHEHQTPLDILYQQKRFGQKNGKGFYQYIPDKKTGAPQKTEDAEVEQILKPCILRQRNVELTDEAIVERMMIPMILEAVRCLEEKIVEEVFEVDMGVLYGLGFPPFRGGVLRYADAVGVQKLLELSEKYQKEHGGLYAAPKLLKEMASRSQRFYPV